MERRVFLKRAVQGGLTLAGFGLVGCGKEGESEADLSRSAHGLFLPMSEVILYDTYAQALYFDGGMGPKTGIVKVEYILKNEPVTIDFWHGHSGKIHKYTVTPEHFAELKKLKRVTLETTSVDSHKHKLFIDPVDPRWRVPGAQPIPVPVL